MLKSICVFCGSSRGNSDAFIKIAKSTGEFLAENEIQIIYGGARYGLMGVIADSALSKNGTVVGILPEFMMEKEVAHPELTRLEIVPTMHKRKERMNDLSDAFLILPGGIGTMDEFFEMLTWKSLNLHSKPIIVLNTNGFFSKLEDFLIDVSTEWLLHKRKIGLYSFYHPSASAFRANYEIGIDKINILSYFKIESK